MLDWGGEVLLLLVAHVQDRVDIIHHRHVRQERNQVQQFGIVRVIKPRGDWDRIGLVEDIAGG